LEQFGARVPQQPRADTFRFENNTALHHRAKAAKRVKPAKAATTNRAALGMARMGEPQRTAVFKERLRGLCEIVKAEKISADSWRASCAKGDAFIIKIYSDGFMTVTRS
jgi:hypothetical protein